MDGNVLLTAPTVKMVKPEQTTRLAELDAQRVAAEKRIPVEVEKIAYTDPATLVPPPPVKEQETMLVGDDFPTGAKVSSHPAGRTLTWVSKSEGSAADGDRALKISGTGIAQDVWEGGTPPIEVPPGARFTLSVFIDATEPPRAVMIQFNTNGWRHRAMWGDDKAIPGWGAPNTGERFVAGPLPAVGSWVKLEVSADKMGLKSGDKINGIAFTLDGGTAIFDALTLISREDDAHDPAKSLSVWLAPLEGRDTPGLQIGRAHV